MISTLFINFNAQSYFILGRLLFIAKVHLRTKRTSKQYKKTQQENDVCFGLKSYIIHYLLSAKLLSPFLPLCIHPPFLSDVVFVHGNYQLENEYISRHADNKLTNLLQKLPSLLKIAISSCFVCRFTFIPTRILSKFELYIPNSSLSRYNFGH